jgi:hypothetical protein
MSFNELQPLQEALDKCTGECALGLTWRDGVGFGLVMLGETKDAKNSQYAVNLLRRVANRSGANVKEESGLVKLPDAKVEQKNVHILPCWGARNQWLTFSTNPGWLANGAKCNMCMPGDVEDYQFAGVGNFEFLPSVLDWADESSPSSSTKNFTDTIRRMEINKAEWVLWATINSDGSSAHSVMLLKNWSWRKALQSVMRTDQ